MKKHQMCTRCLMDTTVPDIHFDKNGMCNYCKKYKERIKKELHCNKKNGQEKFQKIIDKIKKDGKNKKYDCLIGLSGGVDSSYCAYIIKKIGLRPLAVHVDNGWNTEISVKNIKKIVKKLNIDLYNYRINWEEFKNLQLSFLKSSIANCEIPTDHAITSVRLYFAKKNRIKYIIGGGNIATEGMTIKSWGYDFKDWKLIKNIHKKFGKKPLKNFIHVSLINWFYYIFIKKIKIIPILNYLPYNKEGAENLLKEKFSWESYKEKHFESIYTRFFQAYILPTKFNIDKRKPHLSNLILSGQITRDAALEKISQNPYPSEKMRDDDKKYILKKLNLSEKEFQKIMNNPVKSFNDYPNNNFLFIKFNFFINLAKKIMSRNY